MSTAILAVLLAQGGPPLLTDDPGTPGDGRVELNVAFAVEKFRQETLYEAPLLDFNYGVGERIQLKVEVPWLFRHETPGPDESGLGNVLLGVKSRFLDQEASEVDVSMYPQVEIRASARSRRSGLVGEGMSLVLPFQAERDFGPVAVNVEFGYLLVEEEEDAWVWGLALGREILEGVELLGEIHGESGQHFDRGELVWNVGARVVLSELNTLLASVGRGFRGESRSEPGLIAYVGLQFNF
jgi:hypothetical protein